MDALDLLTFHRIIENLGNLRAKFTSLDHIHLNYCMLRLTIALLFLGFNALTFAQVFTNVTIQQGISFAYQPGSYGGGVSFVDFDQDGLDDITFSQNGFNPVFYKNNGTTFQAVTSYISNNMEVKSLVWVDYDNDSDLDIFVVRRFETNSLYQNNGDMTFTDVTLSSGLLTSEEYMSESSCWGDYDRDGDLDMYLSTYNGYGFAYPQITNFLYRNNGNGTFTDVTLAAGVANGNCYTFQSLWIDYDKDFWPDLLVTNDRYECPNYLYHNNRDGTFTDVSESSGIGDQFIFSMNAGGEDFDNDGDLDIYITNGVDGNVLHQNNGDGTFTDVAAAAGVEVNDFTWGAQFFDYDLDSDLDLHMCCTPFWGNPGQNKFFSNDGDGTFTNSIVNTGFSNDVGWSHCSAIGDFNNDGSFDLVISNQMPTVSKLFRGPTPTNSWLKVKAQGTVSNTNGIGSWIECYANEESYVHYTYCGESYLSQNSHSEIFGLGSATIVDSLIVQWTSGIVDKWYNLAVNQSLTLVEGSTFQPAIVVSGPSTFCVGDQIELSVGEFQTYLWSTGEETPTITVTESGDYWCAVSIFDGLIFNSESITIDFSPLPVVEVFSSNVSCQNASDGLAEIQTVESILSEVIWNNGENFGLSIDSLPPGTYSYVATDIIGCVAIGEVLISEPNAIEILLNVENNLCAEDNEGNAGLVISGGTEPYQVLWSGLSGEGLPNGEYTVEITDANGCVVEDFFEITSPDPLQYVFVLTEASWAFGLGSAEVAIQGGTLPYNILWSNSGNETIINDLEPGFYGCLITDANGCSVSGDFVILYNGLSEELSSNDLIFPNPATHKVNIANGSAPHSEYWLYDALGREVIKAVKNYQSNSYEITLTGLPAGGYFVVSKNLSNEISFIGNLIKLPD